MQSAGRHPFSIYHTVLAIVHWALVFLLVVGVAYGHAWLVLQGGGLSGVANSSKHELA